MRYYVDMKALTVRQPWAWLIIHAGKDIENRTWATRHRGDLLIHASKKPPTRAEMDIARDIAACCGATIPDMDNLEYGGIIGKVALTGCTESSDSRWFFGPVGWKLANPQPLPFEPAMGQLGIFDYPAK